MTAEQTETKQEIAARMTATTNEMKAVLRRVEVLGKPVVSAINGAALGGGLRSRCTRTTASRPTCAAMSSVCPRSPLGLLPGGGGVVRTVRLLGIQNALMSVLLQGTRFKPAKAKEIGLIDEVVLDRRADPAAKAWIAANPKRSSRNVKGYKMPGGGPTNPAFAGQPAGHPGDPAQAAGGANMPAPGDHGRGH